MKPIKCLCACLVVGIFSASGQNPFRVRVVDSATNDNLAGAIVYIDQIPSSDKWTDPNGIAFFNNLPADRKVTVHVKKQGYKSAVTQAMASPKALPDNNITVSLEKENNITTILIWGTISDLVGNDVSKVSVRLTYFSQTVETTTDNYGNYRFKIPKETFANVKTYTIEAKIPSCKFIKSAEPYYGGVFENKNYTFLCTLSEDARVKETTDFGSINLLGSWACNIYEEGIKQTIVLDFRDNGECHYQWYHDGLFDEAFTSNWKYYDNFLIESMDNVISFGKMNWNSVDDFYLTVIDNGSDRERGEKRHYVRVK